ncbi:hypothetical protein HMPREF3036_00336 [Sutterella sp. KLE1602]|nr:hypothetical protein HMPREF3036_00336 [Sutterella sp. KLE1602]
MVLRIVREASKKMREGHGRAIRVWRRRLQNKKRGRSAVRTSLS